MSILKRVINLPSFLLKNQKVPINSARRIGDDFTVMGQDGKTYIRNGYKLNPHVYSVVKYIARELKKAKIDLYQIAPDGTEEKIEGHDIIRLMKRPNPNQSGADLLESLYGYKSLTGEAMIHMLYPDHGPNKGVPQELSVIPPMFCKIEFNNFGTPVKFKVDIDGRSHDVTPEEMIYLKNWNPEGNRGMSPLQAARHVVTQSNDAYKANLRQLQNSGAQGVLSNYNDNETLMASWSEEKRDKMERDYYTKYGGAENRGRIMISPGKWKWEQIGLSAVDMDLLNSHNYSLRDICNVFGISSQIMGDPTNKTYANVKEARKELISNIIIGEMNAITGALNNTIVKRFEQRDGVDYELRLDTSVWPELQEDRSKQVDYLLKAWWMKGSQKQEAMGLPVDDDPLMDEYYIPSNLMPLNISVDDMAKLQANEYRRNQHDS